MENLPDGITVEMLDEYARAKANERRREYYRNNPEKGKQHRIRSAINLLSKNGYEIRKLVSE